jgi:hypothetical protein
MCFNQRGFARNPRQEKPGNSRVFLVDLTIRSASDRLS